MATGNPSKLNIICLKYSYLTFYISVGFQSESTAEIREHTPSRMHFSICNLRTTMPYWMTDRLRRICVQPLRRREKRDDARNCTRRSNAQNTFASRKPLSKLEITLCGNFVPAGDRSTCQPMQPFCIIIGYVWQCIIYFVKILLNTRLF